MGDPLAMWCGEKKTPPYPIIFFTVISRSHHVSIHNPEEFLRTVQAQLFHRDEQEQNSTTAIGVFEKMMTAFNSNDLKNSLFENFNNLLAFQ